MSELDMNGFFEALKKEKEIKLSNKILSDSKKEEDTWWDLYRLGLVKYKNNRVNRETL